MPPGRQYKWALSIGAAKVTIQGAAFRPPDRAAGVGGKASFTGLAQDQFPRESALVGYTAPNRIMVPMTSRLAQILIVLMIFSSTALGGEVERRILHIIRTGCAAQSNAACIKALWKLFDAGRDGVLSLNEISGTATALTERINSKQNAKTGTMVKLPFARLLGPASARVIMAAYDDNGDGRLTRRELAAHFRPGEMRRLYADARRLARSFYAQRPGARKSPRTGPITITWRQVNELLKTLLRP